MPEKIQRTNPKEGEFSPSGIETARCFRKFYYQKILGLKAPETPVALVFGIAIHSAVELYYQLHETGVAFEDIEMQVVQRFVEKWTEAGILGDSKRNLESGILIMKNYCKEYQYDTSKFELADIESDQWIKMPNGCMMLVKIDRILNMKDQIIVDDTKTTGMAISEFYFKQFENHLPTTLYYYVVQEILGRCDSIRIDAIRVPPPPATSKTAPFGRQMFFRTDLQVQDALIAFCSITDYITSALQAPEEEWPARFYCNQSKCYDYGRPCEYLGICKHGLDHPSVQVDFARTID